MSALFVLVSGLVSGFFVFCVACFIIITLLEIPSAIDSIYQSQQEEYKNKLKKEG